jgi:hypothetical protein
VDDLLVAPYTGTRTPANGGLVERSREFEFLSPASLLSIFGALLTVVGVGVAVLSGNLLLGVPISAVGVSSYATGAWLRRGTERTGSRRSRAWMYWLLILGLIVSFRAVTPLYDSDTSNTAAVATPSVVAGECVDAGLEAASCTEPHFAEVFFVTEYPLDAPYPQPQDQFFQRWQKRHCHERFAAYVGVSVAQSTYDVRVLLRPRSWSTSHRPIFCTIANADSSPLTQSVRGTAQ